MTQKIDFAFDRFQKHTTNDVQKIRCRRSTNVRFKKYYIIDVIFLLLDRRNLDSKRDDDSEKHHASEDEKLFNE